MYFKYIRHCHFGVILVSGDAEVLEVEAWARFSFRLEVWALR